MRIDDARVRLGASDARSLKHTPGWLSRTVTVTIGAVLLAAAFAASLLVFAAALTIGLLAWTCLWWKTRKVRKPLHARRPNGRVIEGEVIRDVRSDAGA
jgi:hypothetical protein